MKIIGIDFGTSCNKVACFDEYGLKVMHNNHRNSNTPSVALLIDENKWIFGEQAVKESQKNQEQLIYYTKNMLGRNFEDSIIQNLKNSCNFGIEKNDNNIKIIIKVDNKQYHFTPLEITEKILTNLLKVTKLYSYISDSMIVISIPTLYTKKQTNELTQVCKSAQFQNFTFKKEPVLAAIAYLSNIKLDLSQQQNIAVFNFGMQYIEFSIIKIHDNAYELLTEQNENINSKQIDLNIYKYILSKMKTKYPEKNDFFDRPNIQSKLLQKCEEAKITLSELDNANIVIDYDKQNKLYYTLTIREFNDINSQIFNDINETLNTAIIKADIQTKDINHLFLVGGCTLTREIQNILREKIGREPSPFVDPREAVALGACIAGIAISNKKNISEKSVVDILIQPEENNFKKPMKYGLENAKSPIKKKNNLEIAFNSYFYVDDQNPKSNTSSDNQLKIILRKLVAMLTELYGNEKAKKFLKISKNELDQPVSDILLCIGAIQQYYKAEIKKVSYDKIDFCCFINDISEALFDDFHKFDDIFKYGFQKDFVEKCRKLKESFIEIKDQKNNLERENNLYDSDIKKYEGQIERLEKHNYSLIQEIFAIKKKCNQLETENHKIASLERKYNELEKEEKGIIALVCNTFNDIINSNVYSSNTVLFKCYINEIKGKIKRLSKSDEEIRKLVDANQYQPTLDAVKSYIETCKSYSYLNSYI